MDCPKSKTGRITLENCLSNKDFCYCKSYFEIFPNSIAKYQFQKFMEKEAEIEAKSEPIEEILDW